MKITKEQLDFIYELAEQAKKFSKNRNLTPTHREQCKNEARVYCEILAILTETEVAQTVAQDEKLVTQ